MGGWIKVKELETTCFAHRSTQPRIAPRSASSHSKPPHNTIMQRLELFSNFLGGEETKKSKMYCYPFPAQPQ